MGRAGEGGMYLPLAKARAEFGHLLQARMHCSAESTFPEQQMQRRHASSLCVYVSVKHMTALRCIPALQHGPHDDDVSSDSTEGGSSCFTSPERLQASPKPLTKRFPSIPPLSGQRGLATAARPPLPATPLRQLQITSPDREGHRGRIYRDPQRHLLVSSPAPKQHSTLTSCDLNSSHFAFGCAGTMEIDSSLRCMNGTSSVS